MRLWTAVALIAALSPALAAEPEKGKAEPEKGKAEMEKGKEDAKKPWQTKVTVENKKGVTLAVKRNDGKKEDYNIEFQVMRLKPVFSPPSCSVNGDWKKSYTGKGDQPVTAKFPQDFGSEDLKGNFVWQAVVNGETVASGTMRRT